MVFGCFLFYFLRISSGLVWLLNRTKCKENKTVTFVCHTFMMRFSKWELILFCLCGFEIFFFIVHYNQLLVFVYAVRFITTKCQHTHIISVKRSGCKTHHIQLKICSCFSIFISRFLLYLSSKLNHFRFFCCCLETDDRFVMCHHANECYKIIIYCQ